MGETGDYQPTRGNQIARAILLTGGIAFCTVGAFAQSKLASPQAKAKAVVSQPASLPRLIPMQSLTRPPAHRPAAPAKKFIPLNVPVGTPLRVALLKRVRIGKLGRPVVARVIEPVYSFNRIVVPVGSRVDGKVIQVIPAPKFRRAEAVMNGNFSTLDRVQIEFNTLILKNGTRVSIETSVSPGIRSVIQLVAKQGKAVKPGLLNRAKRAIGAQWHGAMQEARKVVSFRYLKSFAIQELPYHRRYLEPGTVFDADLLQPLRRGRETFVPSELADYGDPPPANSVVQARLVSTVSSATAHKGTPVAAIITKPLFSRSKKLLLLPEGTELEGVVVQAHPAKRFHRNGLLRIAIHKMVLPSGVTSLVDANITGLAVGKGTHIQLDSEGGATIPHHRSRYLDTALSMAIATSTFDSDARRAASSHGDLTNRGVAGGSGFRLVGMVVGAVANSRAVGQALGIYGAAWSVYDHFIAGGHNVVLRKDTPMSISFGSQQPSGD